MAPVGPEASADGQSAAAGQPRGGGSPLAELRGFDAPRPRGPVCDTLIGTHPATLHGTRVRGAAGLSRQDLRGRSPPPPPIDLSVGQVFHHEGQGTGSTSQAVDRAETLREITESRGRGVQFACNQVSFFHRKGNLRAFVRF